MHFDNHAQLEVKRAIQSGTALENLFRAGQPSGEAVSKIDDLLNREPSPYDSHPAPRDRIRWVQWIATQTPPDDGGGATVWDLFADRAWVEREMTLVVYGRLAMQGIRLPPLPAAQANP